MFPVAVIYPNHDFTLRLGGHEFGFQEYDEYTVLILDPVGFWQVLFSAEQGLALVAIVAVMLLAALVWLPARRLRRRA